MALGVLVERCKHYGEYNLDIVADEVAEIFVVPKIQSTLSNLSRSISMLARYVMAYKPGNAGWPQIWPTD